MVRRRTLTSALVAVAAAGLLASCTPGQAPDGGSAQPEMWRQASPAVFNQAITVDLGGSSSDWVTYTAPTSPTLVRWEQVGAAGTATNPGLRLTGIAEVGGWTFIESEGTAPSDMPAAGITSGSRVSFLAAVSADGTRRVAILPRPVTDWKKGIAVKPLTDGGVLYSFADGRQVTAATITTDGDSVTLSPLAVTQGDRLDWAAGTEALVVDNTQCFDVAGLQWRQMKVLPERQIVGVTKGCTWSIQGSTNGEVRLHPTPHAMVNAAGAAVAPLTQWTADSPSATLDITNYGVYASKRGTNATVTRWGETAQATIDKNLQWPGGALSNDGAWLELGLFDAAININSGQLVTNNSTAEGDVVSFTVDRQGRMSGYTQKAWQPPNGAPPVEYGKGFDAPQFVTTTGQAWFASADTQISDRAFRMVAVQALPAP